MEFSGKTGGELNLGTRLGVCEDTEARGAKDDGGTPAMLEQNIPGAAAAVETGQAGRGLTT